MIAKVTQRTELGLSRPWTTARPARVELCVRLSPAQCAQLTPDTPRGTEALAQAARRV